MTGIQKFTTLYVLVENIKIFIEIWRIPSCEFEKHTAKTVDIICEGDSLFLEHFGREVCWTAAEGHGEVVLFAEAKVCQLNVSIFADKNILRFHIAI